MVMATSETAKTAESASLELPSQQGADGSTSKTEPRTYTEEEHKKILTDRENALRGEEGRKHKIALTQAEKRATEKASESLAELKEENDKLQTAIDELSADDEDRTRLVKLLRENKKEQDELKKLKQEWEPRIAEAQAYELTIQCLEIAGEYGEGADPIKLERLAKRAKLPEDTDEREDLIREIADEIFPKKTQTSAKSEETPPRKTDSGITSGVRFESVDKAREEYLNGNITAEEARKRGVIFS